MEHFNKSSVGMFRVSSISSNSIQRLSSALNQQGFVIYELDCDSIFGKPSLLSALAKSLKIELDSPLQSWDAAADYIWQAFMERPAHRVALLWKNSQFLVDNNFQILLDAIEFMSGVAESVERQPQGPDSHPVLIRIFLAGEGRRYVEFN